MNIKKQYRETRLNELVETHNLVLSLKRLMDTPHDNDRWKRALYHALSMNLRVNRVELGKIREALDLP
jgi:hypothetical protein